MYNGFWASDRRRFARLKVNMDVVFRVESPLALRAMTADKMVGATVLDIGRAGMAILSRYQISPEAVLILEFTLFKTDRNGMVSFYDPVEIVGEVRSCVLMEDGLYRLGLMFKALRRGEGTEISDFMAESLRQ